MAELLWKNLTGMYRDLTSTLIEHLWDQLDCEPGLLALLTNALLEERLKIPINTPLKLVESLHRRVIKHTM